jgi:hypothetical protein
VQRLRLRCRALLAFLWLQTTCEELARPLLHVPTMNKLKGTRRIWWLVGMGVVLVGVGTALVVLPLTSPTAGAEGPDIQVPKMQNVPPEGAPKLRLGSESDSKSESEPEKAR